ncbi:histidine--tRNA ligase [Desulfatibacillum aliphaticivorans]|uniref:histidine--tRNA ligase n=1 Tax=Desulfatibacillum aliphaticivorans TaxID=218208 RepID=UPI00041AB522|nr:histidine--tRNA ligase [Desulfatibacillum aliphaticivorans]
MIKLIRGFRDILPGQVELWQDIESKARVLLENFGFREIRLPIMENTELFSRGIGADTDIVEKEMYTFPDSKGRGQTLRPEATASVVRSYIEHGYAGSDPVQKFYTIGPMFRHERPQKGRYRQFYQINAEMFGVASPLADVQIMYMLHLFFTGLDVPDVVTHVNSLGCPECRPKFREALISFVSDKMDRLCSDCQRRADANPLRVIDCKVPGCKEAVQGAPSIQDHLCPDCKEHFEAVIKGLDDLNVPYEIDPRLVRGLDYYTRTTFEVQTTLLGAQNAVAGGGRYDGLVKILGGKETPAIGFAVGFDRLAALLGAEEKDFTVPPALFIAALGDEARKIAFGWLCDFNARGVRAEMDYEGKSLKSQMKQANRFNAGRVLILGENELQNGMAVLRNMDTKEQEEVALDGLTDRVAALINQG